MDQKRALNIANRYIENLKEKYSIKKVYLYGSFAKGTQHKDSDIDLAIILENISDIIKVQVDLLQMRQEQDLLIEPHPFRENDFNINNPTAYEIMKHGIELKRFSSTKPLV